MRKKLLLADDSITIQKVVELTFPSDEFEVVTAGNGRIAIDKAMTFLPDVVLCDVVMPQLDGYQVCEAIRALPQLKNVPILLLNGAFEPYDAERARAVGALGNVSKPFDPPALVARVKDLLFEHATAAFDRPDMEALAARAEDEAEEAATAPHPFVYDESETHPVSTVEVPLDVREIAARSLSLDAPVFAPEAEVSATEPEVLSAEEQPSGFSETLHGAPSEEIAPVEELAGAEPLEEPIETIEPVGPVAATGEFEAPTDLESGDAEPFEFDSAAPMAEPSLPGTLPPRAAFGSPEQAAEDFAGESDFEPEELGDVQTEAIEELAAVPPPQEIPETLAMPEPEPELGLEPEPAGLPDELSVPEPMAAADLDPDPAPMPDEPVLPAPAPWAAEPAAAPPEPESEFAAALPDLVSAGAAAPPMEPADVAVPMDMVQQIAQRVISQVSERVIREIAWEVIPALAEKLVKAEIERIKARAESERD